jgi:hypothetical protein
MGVKLVTKHTRDITHHIIANITAPLHSTMLLSLLNPASLVNPQWLVELLHRGYDAAGLETNYDLPLESSYLPHIDPTVSEKHPSMVKTESWKPSMNRKALFDDVRIIFAVIGSGIGSSTKAMADVVTRGGADRQLVNVEREAEEIAKGASGSWVTVLKKRKVVLKEGMRSGLVLVGDAEAMTARGVPRDIRKTWENLVEKAKRYARLWHVFNSQQYRSANMRVINPSLIAEAILKADISLLDCAIDGDNEPDITAESSSESYVQEIIRRPYSSAIRHCHQTPSLSQSLFPPPSRKKHPNYQERTLLQNHQIQMIQVNQHLWQRRPPSQVVREDSPVGLHRKRLHPTQPL